MFDIEQRHGKGAGHARTSVERRLRRAPRRDAARRQQRQRVASWFEIDPCYIFHPFNAFEDADGRLVLDVCRYPELWREGSTSGFDRAQAHRYTLDLAGGSVREAPLDDRGVEFPRIDDRLGGLPHRFGYAVWNDMRDRGAIDFAGLVKYDQHGGDAEVHAFGPGRQPGEAVFVPAHANAAEDEGFVLAYVYDANRDGSDFVVLDAANIAGPALATVALPQRVPFGFHGNWVPDA